MSAAPLPRPSLLAQARLIRRILSDPQPVLDELAATCGSDCEMGAGPMRMAIIGDPTSLRDLFSMPTDNFRWNHKFNVLGFVVGPGSMIVSDGPDHKRRRGSVQAAFSRRRLNGWIPGIVEQTDAAIDRLESRLGAGSEVIDLYPVGRALVLEVVVRALFGPRLGDRAEEIGTLFQRPQDYLESSFVRQLPHPFPFGLRPKVRADRQAIDRIIDEEIADRRQHQSGEASDTIAALVADGTLTDAEIRDQVATLVGAGYDTTAASLAWMLWCAALTPGIWSRLRDEADAVLGPDAVPDESTLAKLEYANRVMRETLRLHPAGVISPREAAADIEVNGHRIRKGTLILWSAHLAGRNPEAWPDPLRFDPDRFLDPDRDQKALADIAWVPFGRGARNCIGFAVAQMELTLIIARLAQRLTIEPVRTTKPRPVGMVVNRPSGGVPMRVSVRD